MKEYNVSNPPDPQEWLSLDEVVRLDMVEAFVVEKETHIEDQALRIHESIHVIVENATCIRCRTNLSYIFSFEKAGFKST